MRPTVPASACLALALALAGCLSAVTGAGAGPADAEARADDLVLRLFRDPSSISPGETAWVNATVTNEGATAVGHRDGCGQAWDVAVTSPSGDDVDPNPRTGSCAGFSWADLYPLEETSTKVPWNGTVWNGTAWTPAESGNHTIAVTFSYTPDGSEDAGAEERLTAEVDLVVEEET